MVIMCYNMQEAQEVFQLESFVEQLDLTQSARELALTVGSSPDVRSIFDKVRNFYPVAYGIKEVGIYRDWCVTLHVVYIHHH